MRGIQRRWFSISMTLFSLALTIGGLQYVRDQLGDEAMFTGWVLLGATAGLYLLPLRKKLIAWRVGPVAGWLQMHVYMGTFACCVFLLHIGWPVRGVFEGCLAAAYVVVSGTGILLGFLSRSTPKRLAAIGTDYHLEQIPARQFHVAQSAHTVALSAAEYGEGATLSEFYQRRLLPYFQTQRGLLYTLLPNGVKRRQLLRELNSLDRYLGSKGVVSREKLSAMVKGKDDLDYHFALQTRLRLFFASHVALTWALAIMTGVHVVLVHRFQANV